MENIIDSIKFNDKGLIPAVVQDDQTNEVLMVAYMNKEALERTMQTGKAHYWSRSRNKLWLKGETSGHLQYVNSVKIDCDEDTLLLRVRQVDAACHTGNHSCFYRDITAEGFKVQAYEGAAEPESGTETFAGKDTETGAEAESVNAGILKELYEVIADRQRNPKEGSYTNYLFTKGLDKILKKVGEETAEVIIAAKNKDKDEIRYEVADLIYHLFVLMVERGLTPEDIYNELKKRR